MREIKFRGKRIDNGEWAYGYYAVHKMMLTGEMDYFIIVDEQRPQSIDPETVGQYTGLKDKNGKEIYEGDLVQDNLGYGAVEYRETRAGFRLNYVDGLAKWFLDYTDDEFKTIEIIGDIYKTEDLKG